MLTPEDIKLMTEMMSNLMDEKLKPINERLDSIDEQLDDIKERLEIVEENSEIAKSCSSDLIEWVDFNFHDQYPFPVEHVDIS